MDNEKCFIIFTYLAFPIFYRYMGSWMTTQKNIVKSKMFGIPPVTNEEDVYFEEVFFL